MEEAPLALRATRPHTVGYIEVCDQEEGVIEYPSRQRRRRAYLDVTLVQNSTIFCLKWVAELFILSFTTYIL